MRIESLLAVLLVAASPLAAGEIRVPGDQPTLCEAILAAVPGDVILVQTTAPQQGCWQTDGALVIDKPLTIVGDPVCNIPLGDWHGIVLDGPGSGAVTLVGVEMAYHYDSDGQRGLVGGGFDELHLYGSRIDQYLCCPTGLITRSFPAIDVTVPLVVLVESFARGGNAGSDHCTPPDVYIDGATGIEAKGSTVILADSEVRGGNGFVWGACCMECACNMAFWPGLGGEGVVAADLCLSGSIVAGGQGASWTSYEGWDPYNPIGPGTPCGSHPDATAMMVSGAMDLLSHTDLTTSGIDVPLGGQWKVVWEPGRRCDALPFGCLGLLLGDFTGLRMPTRLLDGLLFLDRETLQLFWPQPLVPGETVALPVPGDLALTGMRVAAQVMEPPGHFSRPVTGVLLP